MDPYKLSMTASSGLWDAPKLNDDCSCLNTLLGTPTLSDSKYAF